MVMAARIGQVLDEYGRAVPGASVYVYDAYGNLASLTSDGVISILNPLSTDQFGNYSYQALVAYYREDVWFNGQKRWSENNVALGSPGADLTLRTDLAASSGSSLVDFIASGTGALARPAQAKLREVVSVTDFTGADPTGVSDSLAAFNSAFASGKAVFVPEGTYSLSSFPTAPTGTFRLFGAGKEKSVLLITHNAAQALLFQPASVTNYVEISGLTLQANYVSGPCPLGINIAFPSTTSYPYSQVSIDVEFRSNLGNTTAPYAQTWGRGVRLTNVWYPSVKVNGSSSLIVGDTGNTGCLEVTGGSYGMVGAEIDAVWYYGADGIRGSAYMESLKLSSGTEFVGVTKGLYVPATTPFGGAAGTYRAAFIDLGYAHIAAATVGVDLDTCLDFKAERSVERWGSATGWIGFKLNQVLYPQIHCRISGNGTGISATGIVATGGNSAHAIITNVHFDNLDTQFTTDSSTSFFTIRDNRSTGSASDVYTLAGNHHNLAWLNSDGSITYKSDQLSGPIMTGTYTPTLTNVANVTANGNYTAQYSRIGNMVRVNGRIDITATAGATLTQIGISLPVASVLAAVEQCTGGGGGMTTGAAVSITGDTTNHRAQINLVPAGTTLQGYTYSYQYQVI